MFKICFLKGIIGVYLEFGSNSWTSTDYSNTPGWDELLIHDMSLITSREHRQRVSGPKIGMGNDNWWFYLMCDSGGQPMPQWHFTISQNRLQCQNFVFIVHDVLVGDTTTGAHSSPLHKAVKTLDWKRDADVAAHSTRWNCNVCVKSPLNVLWSMKNACRDVVSHICFYIRNWYII